MKINVLSLAFLAAVCSCSKPVEQTDNAATIHNAIQLAEDDNTRRMNSNEVDSIVKYYADDAVSYDSNSKPLHGKEEIRESMQELSKGFKNGASIKYTVTEVFPMAEDRVLEIGHYKISDRRGTNYGSGNYFSLFEKRDGKYVCIRDIQTPDSRF